MKQWEIFLFPHPSPQDPHLGVVISSNNICANPEIHSINVLACQTVRPPTRERKSNEVYLNGTDGLDWKTLVKCDFILVFNKAQAIQKRGEVSPRRIAEIRKTLKEHI